MKVCAFCGSAIGRDPVYADTAEKLGSLLARNGITLVYGGGNVGLMGILADSVMNYGGEVVGIIPRFLLDREVGHEGISRLEVVDSMHQRKQRMATLADAFLALPGGWGTLEELAEILTWRQLRLVERPIVLLNVNGFFDPLLSQMNKMAVDGFLDVSHLDMLQIAPTPASAIAALSRKMG